MGGASPSAPKVSQQERQDPIYQTCLRSPTATPAAPQGNAAAVLLPRPSLCSVSCSFLRSPSERCR
eukprot:3638621-Alexandrium_andersonii.AAC.1